MEIDLNQSSHEKASSTITNAAANVQNVTPLNAQNVAAPNARSVAAPKARSVAARKSVATKRKQKKRISVAGAPKAQNTRNVVGPSDETVVPEILTAKRRSRKRSKVWKHFTEVVIENQRKAQCEYCKEFFSGESTSGTSHLKRHLNNCPSRLNTDIKNYLVKSDSPSVAGNANGSLKCYKFDNDELRRFIVLFVIGGSHPFSIVEQKGFRRMMSRANPQFNAFSRHTLKRELLAMYASEMVRIREVLSSAKGRVCLTTDNWKNEYTRQEYICITCHFVDSNWKLQKFIIRFKALQPPYNGINIADEMFSCLSQWGIDHKVFTVTTDNATYNDSMLNFIRVRLNARKSLISNGDFFQVRCCAHILNLIVQAGLEVIKGPLDRIREMIQCIYRSSKRAKKFFDVAKNDFKLQTTRKFRLDMPVRWNSTYLMLDNVIYYRDALIYFGGIDSTVGSYGLSTSEWDDVLVIHKFLKVFYDVTNIFSAVKTPTSNLYFKGVWMIQKTLIEVANDENNVLNATVASMRAKFDKYWSDYNEVLSCATLLDPRCKEKFLLFCYGKIYGKDMSSFYVQKIVDRLRSLFKEYEDPKISVAGTSCGVLYNGCSDFGKVDDPFSEYSNFMADASCFMDKSQVSMYLAEPAIDLKEEIDILDFWSKSSTRYPELASLACDILTIPVSTVASESAFSISGKVITSIRSSLKSKTVQAIMCLRDWIEASDDNSLEDGYFESGSDESEVED